MNELRSRERPLKLLIVYDECWGGENTHLAREL